MLSLALILFGCSQEPEACDSSEFICDTAAWWEKQGAKDQVVDTTTGTWIDIVRRPGCPADLDTFTVSVRVHGPIDDQARVNLWASEDVNGFNEEHPLPSLGPDANGFEELLVDLRDQATPQNWAPGQRSTFVCGEHEDAAAHTYALRIYSPTGELADCAFFSTEVDAEGAIAAVVAGERPEPIEVRDREELTSPLCRTWTLPPGP